MINLLFLKSSVDLKWNKVPKNVEVGLNQELSIECDAIGSPPPTIEWLQHVKSVDSSSNSNGRYIWFTIVCIAAS